MNVTLTAATLAAVVVPRSVRAGQVSLRPGVGVHVLELFIPQWVTFHITLRHPSFLHIRQNVRVSLHIWRDGRVQECAGCILVPGSADGSIHSADGVSKGKKMRDGLQKNTHHFSIAVTLRY